MHYPNRQNQLRFVYTHFKSCDQSLDKTSSDFSNIFRGMQNCAMNPESRMTRTLQKSTITRLEIEKPIRFIDLSAILKGI